MQTLQLKIPSNHMPLMGQLFGKGVGINAETGCTVKQLLCDQVGIAADYLSDRVQTIFLNGRPVDDEAKAVVHNGDVLALSAAMPGLVGTIRRKGGHLAAMRASLTHCESAPNKGHDQGRVTLKLFNMIVRELGPHLLACGVIVPAAEAIAIIEKCPQPMGRLHQHITLDDSPITLTQITALQNEVLLKIVVGEISSAVSPEKAD